MRSAEALLLRRSLLRRSLLRRSLWRRCSLRGWKLLLSRLWHRGWQRGGALGSGQIAEVISAKETCWGVGVEVLGSFVVTAIAIGVVGSSFESLVKLRDLALDLLEFLRESAHIIRICCALQGRFGAIALGF